MTTSVYNSKTLSPAAGILPAYPINADRNSDVRLDEFSLILSSVASSIRENIKAKQEKAASAQRVTTASAYYRNKYGDEFAYCEKLGLESSYMGTRADFNHVL